LGFSIKALKAFDLEIPFSCGEGEFLFLKGKEYVKEDNEVGKFIKKLLMFISP